jgi:SAM-dependent methyltransferase
MTSRFSSRLLGRPALYGLAQLLLAPGARKAIFRHMRRCLAGLPPARRLVDIGCGPTSCLWQMGLDPVGVDLSAAYAEAFSRNRGPAIVASADALPFARSSVYGLWSIGLLHHLADSTARRAVQEMVRVCRPGGYIVVFDAVLPESPWRRPIAWLLRKLDRGRHMRHQETLESLLEQAADWSFERISYSFYGLEGLWCVCLRS